MSGLTIGLLSLDPVNLKILKKSGDETAKKYAKGISPLVKRHHLLLSTLLMANAAAMESLPIFLDRLLHPAIAILISVTAVLSL
jgi:metal transporter CNNM